MILIESQRGECLRLVGYLMVVVVGRIAATGWRDTATADQTAVPVVVVVGWNRWCVVREELHARLDFLLMLLLLADGEVILA